jgi:hypothetical protein
VCFEIQVPTRLMSLPPVDELQNRSWRVGEDFVLVKTIDFFVGMIIQWSALICGKETSHTDVINYITLEVCFALHIYISRGVGVRVPVGSKIFTSLCCCDRPWGAPNLLSNGYRGLFPRG